MHNKISCHNIKSTTLSFMVNTLHLDTSESRVFFKRIYPPVNESLIVLEGFIFKCYGLYIMDTYIKCVNGCTSVQTRTFGFLNISVAIITATLVVLPVTVKCFGNRWPNDDEPIFIVDHFEVHRKSVQMSPIYLYTSSSFHFRKNSRFHSNG